MSNFDFLKDYDNTLWKLGNRIEAQVNTSPSGVKADATTFLEHILKKLLTLAGLKYNSRKPFTEQVDAVFRSDLKMSNTYREKIRSAYNYRKKIHDDFDEIEKHEYQDAINLHEKLYYIAKKFYRDYSGKYDRYKGIPDFKPLELDLSDDELEQLKVPDFNEIIDIKYDYCVICGNPNHYSYSLCCEECNRELDNANNFISMRNAFGKDSKFSKEDLIEFGIAEAYANQLITYLSRQNLLIVKGRDITFNNMNIDKYMDKINKYLSIGELITKFREDKISPSEIKQTKEYKQGSHKISPFYQFYKVINHEILDKFEKDILTTEDIQKSIEYTTITESELQRWYMIKMGQYQKGEIIESFVVFNDLLQEDYLELKRKGLLESDIRKELNVDESIFDFWSKTDNDFLENLDAIKKDLLIKAISEGKTRDEAIEIAGLTSKEYNDLVKVSEFKGDDFSKIRNQELEQRKQHLIEYLKTNDVETSCKLAKVSVDDFYLWYGKDMSSEFYLKSTEILMHNFLNQRRKGKTKVEAASAIGLEYEHVERWFNRTLDICENFKNKHILVIVDLIYAGFKNKQSKKEISKTADVSINRINTYLDLGKRGYGDYKRLYDYYETETLPRQLEIFLDELKHKPLKKALEMSELSQEELDYCCQLGIEGNVRFKEFYQSYYAIKIDIFMNNINKGKDQSKALRNADLTKEELAECYELGKNGDDRFSEFYNNYYDKKLERYVKEIIKGRTQSKALKNSGLDENELPNDIDEIIFDEKFEIVIKSLKQDMTTKQAANKANVSVNDVYDWFLKGRSGDEKFKDFAELYYEGYVNPGSRIVQKALNEDIPLNYILKRSRKHFSREDYDFWVKNGFMLEAKEELENEEDVDDEELVKELKKEIANRL
ncbi:hypothetical protein [uncultured Methanobrevibacter sp.]|uniref:hypothetical protein n=1 Tax=uncultured Methanobrevibacter sp. TaxID=253161 RepID=UPI00262C924C|nr:hypothetical protein [uncultured Methanobrevibacter sp.]